MESKTDIREDLGYTAPEQKRPSVPWSRDVIRNTRIKSPTESPLKQWWLEQQQKQGG